MKRTLIYARTSQFRSQNQKRFMRLEKKIQVKVHLGTCGISSGANRILDAFVREIEKRELSDSVVIPKQPV